MRPQTILFYSKAGGKSGQCFRLGRGRARRSNRMIDYNSLIVELLFNLLWVGISTGLLGLWLSGRRRRTDDAPRHGARMQIAALAVLILILFPVVSLTDDLQACTAPAEVEHLVRRDLDHHSGGDLPCASTILAESVCLLQNAPGWQTILRLSPPREIGAPRDRFLSIARNRPPPEA